MKDLIRDRLEELTIESWWDGANYTEIRDKDYITDCIYDDFSNLISEKIDKLKNYVNSSDDYDRVEFAIEQLKNLL